MDFTIIVNAIISNLPAIIVSIGSVWVAVRNSNKKIVALHTEINSKMTELNRKTGEAALLVGEGKGRDQAAAAAMILIEAAATVAAQKVLDTASALVKK